MWRALVLTLALAGPATAQEFFSLKGHGGPIMDIAVSPSGQIATASFDNSVGLWTDAKPEWLEGHSAAVIALLFPGTGTLFSGGDDFAVRQWSPESSQSETMGTHEGKVTALALSPDKARLASASWDGTVALWSVEDKAADTVILRGHAQGVNDVAFSDDGSALYSASADGTIRVWDVATGTEKRVLIKHGFGVNTLILNEADGWLAYGAVDGVTRLVDPATGEDIKDFSLDRRPILAMTYHAPSHTLAVGDGEGYIMVIDTATQSIIRDFRATARGPIWALAFSPDGRNIHAGGIDDVMFSFPLATLDEVPQIGTAKRSFLQDPGTMTNGERQFKRKCSICHTTDAGSARRAGPSLNGLFGRPAGTVADYSYSPTLEGSDIVWSADTIDALFDLGPDHYIPGSKMPMQRITTPQDRADLIAYLRDATQPEDTK